MLGCSGSYGAPEGNACSGYLLRAGATRLWIDCGNGTFANLQRHCDVAEIDAVIITHSHPDHCVDIYGLHVMYKYGLGLGGLRVYATADVEPALRALVRHGWENTFDWVTCTDGDRVTIGETEVRFARTDHPVPTLAVEVAAQEKRVVYTSDTGPGWSVDAFGSGADLVLSEATYVHRDIRAPIHLSARQAGEAARAAKAKRLVLTHIWPTVDREESRHEGADAFGADVELAVTNATLQV